MLPHLQDSDSGTFIDMLSPNVYHTVLKWIRTTGYVGRVNFILFSSYPVHINIDKLLLFHILYNYFQNTSILFSNKIHFSDWQGIGPAPAAKKYNLSPEVEPEAES